MCDCPSFKVLVVPEKEKKGEGEKRYKVFPVSGEFFDKLRGIFDDQGPGKGNCRAEGEDK
jgi:hypothetical protein